MENAIADLRGVLENGDKAVIDSKMKTLTNLSHKLAEQVYAQASGQAGAGPEAAGPADGGAPQDDNVVDADFEEVKDNK